MRLKLSAGRKVYLVVNYILCITVAAVCLLPMIHILAISFSSKDAIIAGKVAIWPVQFTLSNYQYVIKDASFYRAFMISVERELLAVVIVMLMVILSAYPLALSKSKFSARQFYVWLYVITMLFNGGLVPSYLVVSKTGLINSIWSLILPGAVPVFYVILLQNFIKELPDSLSEAALIDGAGHFRTLFQIILPLCRASLACMVLFIAVDHWNSWFDGMLYINDNMKFPLQTYLRTIIVNVNMMQMTDINSLAKMVASDGADTAKIFVSMIPILMVYPFIQKNFITGLVIGSVKE